MRVCCLSLLLLLLASVCGPCAVRALNPAYGSQLQVFSQGDGLIQPQAMALDSSGSVYVTDLLETETFSYARGRIVKYSSSGAQLTSDISQGVLSQFSLAASWTSVWALAIDSSNNLYTNNGSQVLRLSPNAQSVLFTYPQQFADILSLTVDTSSGATAGYLYVASYLAGTISVLSPNGTLVRVYSVPPGPFNLSTISGAEISQMSLIGSTGSLLATDIFNGVAYVFSSAGSILFNYTLPSSQILFCGTADAAGNLYLAISDADPLGYAVNGRIIKLAAPGYTQTSTVVTEDVYTAATSLLLDSSSNIYVLDGFLYQVRVFSSTGAPKQQIRGGFAAYEFAVDAAGDVAMCDDSTRDALFLNADGSVKAYYPITSLDDGNSACSLIAINRAGTVFAVLNGFGAYFLNGSTTGTLDGTTIYLFNVQTGAVINQVSVAGNDDYFGVAGLAIDDSSNLYYTLVFDANNTQLLVRSGTTGAFLYSFPLRSSVLNYYYTHNIDQNNNLNVYYYWPNAQYQPSILQWDQLTLSGQLLRTTNITIPVTSTSYPEVNSPRVDSAGWLYYMQRDEQQVIAPVTVYATNGTVTLAVYTDSNPLSAPSSIALDGSGNLFVNDVFNHQITKVIGVNSQSSPSISAATHLSSAAGAFSAAAFACAALVLHLMMG